MACAKTPKTPKNSKTWKTPSCSSPPPPEPVDGLDRPLTVCDQQALTPPSTGPVPPGAPRGVAS
ncbi:hypothetical protein ACIPLC_35795 [Kitasatospora sp. NPDC086801]|uniref:hypothetical protein n=1 Tax=Kitasatospora sp. NPDC086801 TaxID=3364066 RepID=UPI003815EEF1